MRYIGLGIIFLIIIAFIMPALADTVIPNSDILVRMPLNRPCYPTDNGILIHSQNHSDGSKVEIVCDGGQYRMKYIKSDGTTVYVGKCPFPLGRNGPYKKLRGTIIRNASGTFITNTTLNKTFWISLDAPPLSFGPPTTRGDMMWVFDPQKNIVVRQETRHEGQWINQSGRPVYVPNESSIRPYGNETILDPAPSSPVLLSLIPDAFSEEGVGMGETTREYVYNTPVPVTGVENGKYVTVVITQPIESEIPEVQTIEAEEEKPFTFDINFPGEKAELVAYTLVEAPEGMILGETDGILTWMPGAGQAGDHTITVSINYQGLTSDIDTFNLPVINASARSSTTITTVEGSSLSVTSLIIMITFLIIISIVILRKGKK